MDTSAAWATHHLVPINSTIVIALAARAGPPDRERLLYRSCRFLDRAAKSRCIDSNHQPGLHGRTSASNLNFARSRGGLLGDSYRVAATDPDDGPRMVRAFLDGVAT